MRSFRTFWCFCLVSSSQAALVLIVVAQVTGQNNKDVQSQLPLDGIQIQEHCWHWPKGFHSLSIQMTCFASFGEIRAGSHYENKLQCFKITGPNLAGLMSSQAIMVKLTWMADAMGNLDVYAKHCRRALRFILSNKAEEEVLWLNRFPDFQKLVPKQCTSCLNSRNLLLH